MKKRLTGTLSALALLLGTAQLAMAAYTTVPLPMLDTNIATWTDGARYNLVFPGNQLWNGVPFALVNDNNNNKVMMNSATIPVNVYGVTDAYSLINTAYGRKDSVNGLMEFYGSDGAYYQMQLIQGMNVRDHYWGGFNNSIDGVNGVYAWNSNVPGQSHLDMQIYHLPASFADETLLNIVFTNYWQNSGGNPFLAGLTVNGSDLPAGTPVPVAAPLAMIGMGALAIFRKQTRK